MSDPTLPSLEPGGHPDSNDPESSQGMVPVQNAPAASSVLGGRWELLGVLGEGGTATVYRAHDRQSGGVVAVKLLDVGSGGGLPGVVFAICCPDVDVSCVDTVGKKAAFIQQAAVALKLRNLHGLHARVETLTTPFDLISCRAFASLPDFVTWSRSALAAPHGVWLAMKGKHPEDEIAALPADVAVFHVEQLTVPGLDAERCIVWMQPV